MIMASSKSSKHYPMTTLRQKQERGGRGRSTALCRHLLTFEKRERRTECEEDEKSAKWGYDTRWERGTYKGERERERESGQAETERTAEPLLHLPCRSNGKCASGQKVI